MAHLVLELREDLSPDEVEARLGLSGARRLFSRPAVELDRELVALQEGGPPLPDRCRFYLAEGELPALDGNPLVVAAGLAEPLGDPVPLTRIVDADLAAAHEAGGRGKGVSIAVIGEPAALAALAPEASVIGVPPRGVLADAIDLGAARLAAGDVLVVPYGIRSPAERAAVAVAARRGIVVVAAGGRRARPDRRRRPRAARRARRLHPVARRTAPLDGAHPPPRRAGPCRAAGARPPRPRRSQAGRHHDRRRPRRHRRDLLRGLRR